MAELSDKRLVFVIGKGGVGKSTVAAALGIAAARRGLRTIVAELSGQDRAARAFAVRSTPGKEVVLEDGLHAITIDARVAMEEYLQERAGRLGGVLAASRAFGAFASATPGMRELLSIGKAWELAQDRRRVPGGEPYDLVIVDAPATGHGLGALQAPRTFAEIARVGPIATQGRTIDATLRDPAQTGVVAVALPEEMPVNETLLLQRRLQDELGIALAQVVVNALVPDRIGPRQAATAVRALDRARTPLVRAALHAAVSEQARSELPARAARAARRGHGLRAARASVPVLAGVGPRRARRARRAVGRRAVTRVARSPAARGGTATPSVAELLDGRRVCVMAGAGGVGKTTTSAAIGMGMAARGLKVAVVTIDPAQRLANALGLDELGNEPHRIAAERFAEAGMQLDGELWAMTLDVKTTFDDLIGRLAPDVRTREQILANRIYRELSGAIAGSQEFSAVAKLDELVREGDFDLLVLDTPPSRNALDFLDAPERLTQFFEGRALRTLLRPTGGAMKLLGRGTGLVLGVLGRITGAELLHDLSDFFRLLGGLVGGFRERATQVEALLRDPATTFLLVSSPEREPIEEAIVFGGEIAKRQMSLGGAIVNRVHDDELADGDAGDLEELLVSEAGLSAALAGRVAAVFADEHALALRDAEHVAQLAERLGDGVPLMRVPLLDGDVHDIGGLVRLHGWLFADAAAR